MQIDNISNTNFQGSFLIKKATPEVKTTLPNIVKSGRIIFDNFGGNRNNILMVVKDKHDNKIREFLEGCNLKFEFFPQFNTYKCASYMGKEHKLPELIENFREERGRRKRISMKDTAEHMVKVHSDGRISVTNIEGIGIDDFVASNEEKIIPKINLEKTITTSNSVKEVNIVTKSLKKSAEYIQNIAKRYEVDPNAIVKNIRGASVIDLKKKGLTILISKSNDKGLHYVKVKPIGQPYIRLVTDGEGKPLFYMNDLSELFDKKFNALLDPKA